MKLTSVILTVILAFVFINVNSQSFVNNGALITIQPNTTLNLGDSVVNNGEITNNGTIIVTGTWQNNQTYNAGTGSIVMSSSEPQVINHNDQSLSTLTVSGGGDKIFVEDIIVVNELILDDGLLKSSNGARIVVSDGGIISGGSADSYIIGQVVHQGTGDKLYPIGIESTYLPFEFLDMMGINAGVGIMAIENNPNSSTVGFVSEVSPQWYWQMETVQGEFDGAGIRLPVINENFNGTINQVVVIETRNLESPYHSLGQREVTGDLNKGTVTSVLRGVGNIFSIGIDASISEPVPPLNVFNVVSPNGDNRHDYLKIENINYYRENNVVIYNRIGQKVFEIDGYDNVDNVFTGESNVGEFGNLPSGTYYYWIDPKPGGATLSGFFVLNR